MEIQRRLVIAVLIGLFVGGGTAPEVGFAQSKKERDVMGELVIFHAGSLSVPFREISRKFNELYPNVTVKAEAAGSRDTARKVCDLGRPCDVLGSADYEVIDNLLIPDHAEYSIRFATNEMIIAFTKRSKQRDSITAKNWPEVLLSDDVWFGRSDPNRDPCGYRTVMVFQLAERYFSQPGLAKKLEEKGGRKFIRPKETDLLALLESGELDYIFIYRSVAIQHRLEYIVLPDEVNLKSSDLGELYATAKLSLTGKKPGEYIERTGAPMVYGVTIPRISENRELAEEWIKLLLSPEGQEIMERNGQPPIVPASTAHFDGIPETLRPLCVQKDVAK
ncbi:MAG: tungstate ABC transporter substrate-binding protein WtpA [Candidatus Latescibacterota bacterium]|nr:MAG: tungstate ABC transporter substrate-binding protein WtpA [Candidatus Latescibacterota bacterium]